MLSVAGATSRSCWGGSSDLHWFSRYCECDISFPSLNPCFEFAEFDVIFSLRYVLMAAFRILMSSGSRFVITSRCAVGVFSIAPVISRSADLCTCVRRSVIHGLVSMR